MAQSDQIIQVLEPKITPPRIDVLDLESPGSDKNIRIADRSGYATQLGKNYPLIMIGGAKIEAHQIMLMEAYYDEVIPAIHIVITDQIGTFTSIGYPKTNPLVTVYVASGHPKLKSFSQTYIITNISSIPLGKSSIQYDITGELYIPNFNLNFVKSYQSMSSYDALRKIAEELQLGYSTNEDSTNDSMTWINPNLNYLSFIQNIVDHAYKNEASYFDWFIDRYYSLNFINVEKQFKSFDKTEDIPKTYPSYSPDYVDSSLSYDADKPSDIEAQISLILSNADTRSYLSDLRILDYGMVGDNGQILKTDGFRKKVILYKHGEDSPVKYWFSEPISQIPNNSEVEYQKPELSDFITNSITKWIGVDYNNSHNHYKFAILLNDHNRIESEKNMLKVTLPGLNHNILRGSRILVQIYATRTKTSFDKSFDDELDIHDAQANENIEKPNATDLILDKYLSDTYYVKSIIYKYNPILSETAFTTEIILCKKNWKPTPKMENNI